MFFKNPQNIYQENQILGHKKKNKFNKFVKEIIEITQNIFSTHNGIKLEIRKTSKHLEIKQHTSK